MSPVDVVPKAHPRTGATVVCLLAAATAVLVSIAGADRSQRAGSFGGPADAATRGLDPDALRDAYSGESWQHLQRTYPTGRLPSAAVVDRLMPPDDERRDPRTKLSLPGSTWVSIGPRPIYVQNQHPWVGRVTAVAPHPTAAGTLYIGADNGGVWRTTNGGGAWTPLMNDIPVPSIQSIAIDPVDPRLMHASTIQRTYGTRLLQSTDAGDTWTVASIALADGRVLSSALCSINVFKACIPPSSGRVLMDPTRAGSAAASTLYYAGASHLLRSDDSGRTFRPVLTLGTDLDFAGPNAATLHPEVEFLRDAAIDPARPERLYVAVAQPRCLDTTCGVMDSAIVLYRSVNAGGTWTRQVVASLGAYSLANTRYADPGAVYVPRVRLAVAPSRTDTLALAFRDEQLGHPRVYRSLDAGETWTETLRPAASLTWPLALTFAPNDPDTMFVGSNGIYRTTNAGATWTTMGATHVDNIVLTFDASGVLVAGNDGGIFRATTGTAFTPLHLTLPITEFYSIAAHPSNPLLLAGGTQDNGTVIYQGSLGWSLITGGDGGDTVFDPSPQNTILYAEIEWYFVGPNNVFLFFRCQPGGCVQRTAGIDLSLAGPFIPRMAMDPANSSTIWLTAERLFRTDNRADSWAVASPSVGAAERCWPDAQAGRTCARARYFISVAVAPTSTQTVYAGTLNGDIWMTENRGATWRSLAAAEGGPLPVRPVNDLVVDPLDAGTVFAGFSGFDDAGSGRGHVFRTTDRGASWRDVSGNLPDVPVNTLLIDPDSVGTNTPRVLYAGTDTGVFRATIGDGPIDWQPFGDGLPPVIVNRLAYNATTRQLLAATYGRGLWAISPRFAR